MMCFLRLKLPHIGFAFMLGLAAPASAQTDAESAPATTEQTSSEFIGTYDGSSFETAMGMRINGDGSFEWFLAVGSLDMRSKGEWIEKNGAIHFTTTPTPVPAEFRFLGLEASDHSKLVHVFREDGSRFTYPDAVVECANGVVKYQFVAGSNAFREGDESEICDRPSAITVTLSQYDVSSTRIDLEQVGWKEGQIARFEFAPNDIGVLDLTGMSGTISDGVLTVDGPLGRETFRKLDAKPQPEAPDLAPTD